MLDPRIDDLFKEIERLKHAIVVLANNLDYLVDPKYCITISNKIRKIIRQKEA